MPDPRPAIRNRTKETRLVRAGDLLPNPANWRKHPAAQRSALAGLLDEVGFVGTVLGRETPDGIMLIDGHLRAELAADTMVNVSILDDDVTDEEADKILLTYDPVGALYAAERANLEALIARVETDAAGTAAMIEGLAQLHHLDAGKPGKTDPDALPAEAPDPITQPGDLWLLGDHRLLCGDATSAEDFARLMDGEQAGLVFTDPPYGVDYASRFDRMANDALTRDALSMFLTAAFRNIAAAAAEGAAVYIWHASATRDDYAYAMKAAGLVEIQYLIWAKGSLVLGHADYQWQHEPCFYAARDGDTPSFYGDRNVRLAPDETATVLAESGLTDVWQVRRDTATAEHPTQKPVELAERALQNSSRAGDVVLDAFLGSGTTLIAAERLGRRCFGMELEPRYVDLAVRRWEDFTGETAARENKSADSP
jgi:DNA modification methylase